MKNVMLLTLGALALSACTVAVRPGVSVTASSSNLIADLQPDRGEGSTYFVGERVRFRFTTRASGYVTLVSLDPDGYGNVLVRDTYVPAGTTLFPRPSDAFTFDLTPPRGVQRVRAIFTTNRATAQIVFSGRYDQNGWRTYTDTYLQPVGASQRDVAETFFTIR
ncbi:DUF4384 domain-containing protein [Deinococcus yavapaiensis]|uniref:Uncharacterized protein DUF4384 n=1 Tax=Deinococcus yavapaiensis KR-236 TaxID=694435 RepID=A0A318SQI1_9DEIO|nr:DUF4384 domain-containing protein [Deinococcus yavapaiensis]PYE55173.1 uncharacterized protein DUF4384 [Deinococcus yavapaiensis KR-236]